jgi:hypothetical protein
MTTHRLSFQVRMCFPTIGRNVVANVNTIVSKIKLGWNNEIDLFPLEDFIPLSPPWKNSRSEESPLTRLSQFDIGERGDGRSEDLKLCNHFLLPNRRRVLVGFFHSVTQEEEGLKNSNQMALHCKRIHEFLLKMVELRLAERRVLRK